MNVGLIRISRPEVLLIKGFLRICCKIYRKTPWPGCHNNIQAFDIDKYNLNLHRVFSLKLPWRQ